MLIPDLAAVLATRWPALSHGMASLDAAAIYSFPLVFGGLLVGVVDLYAQTPNTFPSEAVAAATDLADDVAAVVLRSAMHRRHDVSSDDELFSRREVHQATGMVLAQLGVDPADALLLIRAHAFASGRTVRETAADITARRITLEP